MNSSELLLTSFGATNAAPYLASEMSHRVKNLLAIASGLTAITSRSTQTSADMARELTHRLTALGRVMILSDLSRVVGQGCAARRPDNRLAFAL